MKNKKNIPKNESVEEFERRILLLKNSVTEGIQFRFFTSADCLTGNPILYRRRDFYKVSFLDGDYVVHYGDESLNVSGCTLSFFNPSVPYTIESIEERENAGYFIFTETFYDTYFKESIKSFPLFQQSEKPLFLLTGEQIKAVKKLFAKIEDYSTSNYHFKNDLIRNSINELMHYANGILPISARNHKLSSKERLLNTFNELLDRQFPIDLQSMQNIRSASYFADALNVHVNYLNRVLKELTGKSTTELLHDRLLKESIILLKHTSWSIAEIAYTLGFNDASHFSHFFKKQDNRTPSSYRC